MFDIEPFDCQLRTPLATADGEIDHRTGWLVRIERGDAIGVGAATPLPGWTESSADCQEALAAAAEGAAETDPETALAAMDPSSTPAARHGVALALADGRARDRGVSLAADLATDPATRIPVQSTIGDGSVADTVERATDAVDRGFDCCKVKVGARSVDADADRLRAVRDAVGPDVELRIDANASWDRAAAERFLDRCGDGVDLLEQPLSPDDVAGHAALRDRVAVALDESVVAAGLDAIRAADAADAVVLKPMALGGIDRARDVALRARAAGMAPIVSTTLDPAVARTAALHLAAALPDAPGPHGLATGDRFAGDLGTGAPTPIAGQLPVPEGPGHGIRGVGGTPEHVGSPWPTGGLVHNRARATPDRPGLVDAAADRRLTWHAADRRAAGLAAQLAPEVRADDRVGIRRSTPVATLLTAVAVQRAGAVPVPLPDREDLSVLEDVVERLSLRAIATDEDAADDVRRIAAPDVDAVELPPAGTAVAPTDAIDGGASASPTDTAVVLLTSGTTGTPAGVRLTHRNLLASAVEWTARLGVRPDDRWLAPLAPSHAGGFLPAVRAALTGTTLVTQAGFDATETAALLVEESITGVSVVPTMLARLLEADWTPPDHLRHVLVGGGPIDPELVERCADRNVPITPTYGCTETAAGVATATPDEATAEPGTVGRPHLFTRAVPVDEAGVPCQPGEPGEIAVSGPSVTPGYVDAERTCAAFDEQGRFRTGDRGVRDAAGRLRIRGRLDDRIATGGETVRAARVADALRSHPAVEDAAVVGVDDPEWGERVAALVAGDPDREALAAHARESLPAHAVPKTLAVVDSLPRTASGTVDRDAVRRRCRDDGTPL